MINQPSKFLIKNLVEISDKSHVVYNTGCQIKFRTWSLKRQVYVIIVTRTYLSKEL